MATREYEMKTSDAAGLDRTESPVKSPVAVRRPFIDPETLRIAGEARRAYLATGLVYFVTAWRESGYPIKIGKTTVSGIGRRFAQLQTAMPYRMEVLLLLEADAELEGILHAIFAADHLSGEWYRRTPQTMELLAEARTENPDWAGFVPKHTRRAV